MKKLVIYKSPHSDDVLMQQKHGTIHVSSAMSSESSQSKTLVMLFGLFVFLMFLLISTKSIANPLKTEMIQYRSGDTAMEGYLAYQPNGPTKRPGVLVVHDWMGLGDHYKEIANKLAEMGYVAFAADIYGNGIRPANAQEAAKEAGKYKSDRKLLRERVNAALNQLKANPMVDPKKIAAIGYCFGGTTVIELARSGADIAGIVSFHGGLDSPEPEAGKRIKAKLLILHGADDPFVPQQDLTAFQEELRKAGVDWQMIYYGNNVHSFTTPKAGTDKSKGAAYDPVADARSWKAMQQFFQELFTNN